MVILYPSYDIILLSFTFINKLKGSVNSGAPFTLAHQFMNLIEV